VQQSGVKPRSKLLPQTANNSQILHLNVSTDT
jgi:hypothetical protein